MAKIADDGDSKLMAPADTHLPPSCMRDLDVWGLTLLPTSKLSKCWCSQVSQSRALERTEGCSNYVNVGNTKIILGTVWAQFGHSPLG